MSARLGDRQNLGTAREGKSEAQMQQGNKLVFSKWLADCQVLDGAPTEAQLTHEPPP